MVRFLLQKCFFCDEYRTGSVQTSGEQATTTLRLGETETHSKSPSHLARMSGVLRNRQEFDRVLREVRPTDSERRDLNRCMNELKNLLRAREFHWCGSVGKSTALRGAHDLDVCVKLRDSLVGREAVDAIGQRLSDSRFQVVRKEKHLAFVKYEHFELDIIVPPAERSEPDKWRAQVEHLMHFRKMNAAQKDAVRMLKAWARLCVPLPGILLETIVDDVVKSGSPDEGSSVQAIFIASLQELCTRRAWLDPMQNANNLSSTLSVVEWQQINAYAKRTLKLKDVSLNVGDFCQCSYPCKHCVTLEFGSTSEDLTSECLGTMDAFQIIELSKRLSVRRPTYCGRTEHFGYCPNDKLQNLPERNRDAFFDYAANMLGQEAVKKEFWLSCHPWEEMQDHGDPRSKQLLLDHMVQLTEKMQDLGGGTSIMQGVLDELQKLEPEPDTSNSAEPDTSNSDTEPKWVWIFF